MTDILMPALSPTMEEGTLTKWHIKAGDVVSAGQVIAEIETDKATMEVEAVDEGEVLEILVAEGSEGVKVNTPIARLAGEDGAAAPAPAPKAEAAPAAAPEAKAEAAPADAPVKPKVELRDPEIPADAKLVKTTIRDALRDAMAEEMRRDENVFLMGEEVAQYQGAYKVSRDLLQEFGDRRVVDTPITEHGFAGLGVGAAFSGLKPIVEFMTWNFAMQAIDHIINSAAKTLYMSGGQMGCPIVFRGPNGAAARVAAQHSQDYSAWYAQIPGLKVVAPYDAADAKGLLKAAIRDPNPIVFLEHEMMYGLEFDVPDVEDYVVPIGKAKVRREGTDVTITAHSRMVGFALQAAEKLAEEGVSVEVVDLRTLRPLDHETIVESVKKTNRLVSAEEGWGPMGVGAEVVARVIEHAFDYLDAPPLRVHQEDVPLPYAANLEALSLPGVDKIVAAVKKVMA
ncbi:pyruvate dehydrogenase complex E1 component subunit beta [Brevundimonas diminuta]|uniref:pyruvate dehydrogenase complex E1 component subunit beta n=1 Tax=Brevundimonas diminuta TaxID=293 RepID=UPI0020973A2F|nr:pyruvate dehydrogenase complex E1 component subunit beta [Brevundimonas diminuta]MCO8018784.1 pyruvate dehydrogenase complex E1 component subunit beta [Brevundimonas diminuta]MCO8020364.1 pyruvate dehydrogenase complex E1 component subunit beta [Brevundimonas diminuta]